MLADSATLVSLEIGQLGLSKKDTDLTNKAHAAAGITDTRAGYYRKFKIDRSSIMSISKSANSARLYHRMLTVPWGYDRYRLLPATLLMKYTKKIKNYKMEFLSHVDDLAVRWPYILNQAQIRLGPAYNKNEYPTANEVKSFYKFQIHFKPIPQDDHFILQVEEKTLKEMKNNLNNEQFKNIEDATANLWHRLYEVVDRMATRLDEENPKIFKTLITNIEDLTKILPELNIANNPVLTDMSNDVKNRLCMFTPGQLKKDSRAKDTTAKAAKEIRNKMNIIMGVK